LPLGRLHGEKLIAMTYYADLSRYEYLPTEDAALNVGWLDSAHQFATGHVSSEFGSALLSCAARAENLTRGVHNCEFCGEESPMKIAMSDGSFIWLGMSELHASGADGRRYYAPTLIVHYVGAHGYKPPLEFQEAVILSAGAEAVERRTI
jgi:hypothetical protein